MKTLYTTFLALFALTALTAQEQHIERPGSGQTAYTLDDGETDTLEATVSITLKAGTHIKAGSTFLAQIVGEGGEAPLAYTAYALSDENYILARTYHAPMDGHNPVNEGDVLENVTYFDGLGRPMQQIGIKAAPDKEDIITHVGYDAHGRQDKDWLPYYEPTGTVGTYRGDKASAARSYYKADYGGDFPTMGSATANAYSEKEFEPSPLNRVLRQAAPGESWALGNNHEIAFDYQSNATNEVLLFEVATTFADNTYTPALENAASATLKYYGAWELYKTVTRDENHSSGKLHTTEEFTDKQGRVVLKRTYAQIGNDEAPHDTYYVYDDYGNLTYVLPPKVDTSDGVSATELSELCYRYTYDHRNRLVVKKLPGKGEEHIVYNNLDQPILTQDAELRKGHEWLFTKYDAHGRTVMTGIYDHGTAATRPQMATAYADHMATGKKDWETPTTSGPRYYSDQAFPVVGSTHTVHSVNYYDGYNATRDGIALPTGQVLGQDLATDVTGLPTVSKVRVLGTGNWTTALTAYDKKGRAVHSETKNTYLNTVDKLQTQLDFGGKVIKTVGTHTKGTNAPIVVTDMFDYDHAGRLLKQRQQIGDGLMELIAKNEYGELGQLKSKKVGNTSAAPLQTVDFTYNIRGWLKSVNDPSNLGDDLFAFGINYNNPTHGGTALFNGNISETEWKTANTDSSQKHYVYGYDPLNRIISAVDNTGNYNLNSVTYDKNGNILSLQRNGHTDVNVTSFGLMDDLTYTYTGNQLKAVDDGIASSATQGFVDGAELATEYTYDANGNMTRDDNKGITAVEYNHINLPTKVTVTGSNAGTIDYVYAADGAKLRKTTSTGLQVDYSGGYVYNNGVLQFFPHPEGYVSVGNGSYQYVYNYSDHLGNIRLSYTDADGNGSMDPANEIVEENNYCPMGMKHQGYNDMVSPYGNSIAKKWKFQGVEFEEALDIDLYEMEFRNYDPAIGRFMSIDPLAEQRNWLTPYNFVQNNPIMRVDPSGLLDDYGIDQNGNVTLIKETDDKFDRLYSVTSDENGEVIKDENGEAVKNDTNGDGKVNNRDSSGKIRDRSVLPELAKVKETTKGNEDGEFNLRDVTRGEGSQSDLFKVFNFAANNSNMEWSLYRLNIGGETQFNLGSYGNVSASPGGSRFDKSQWVAGIHSHPNILATTKQELGSMYGDRGRSQTQIRNNGQAAGLKYVYFPNSNNVYNINNKNTNVSFIRNTGGDYRRFFFGTLNSQ